MDCKILIVTIPQFLLRTNYGSLFQAYALQRVVRSLKTAPVETLLWDINRKSLKKRIGLWLFKCLFYFLSPQIGRKLFPSLIQTPLGRFFYPKDFSCFLRKHITLTRFYTSEQLNEFNNNYTHCIVGSDQVWCFDINVAGASFIKCGKKISYAVSAPWGGDVPILETSKGVAALETFDIFSAREKEGVKRLNQLLPSKPIELTLDPTLLLDKEDYLKISSSRSLFKKPTLLCYFLNFKTESDFPISLSSIERLCQVLAVDLKIIPLQGAEPFIPRKYGFSPSPEGFLAAIRDAKYVLTNSFHGTVFSLIMQTPFVSFTQNGAQNGRVRTLLKNAGATDRLFEMNANVDDIQDVLKSSMNWKEIELALASYRASSIDFLKRALTE